jgi:hypothetical protein
MSRGRPGVELSRVADKLTRSPGEMEMPDVDRSQEARWGEAAIFDTVFGQERGHNR